MTNKTSMAEIKSIDELLQMNLAIPNYQRPYKWTRKNVSELFDDIDTAIIESKQYGSLEYRIGSVILHKDEKNYNIVDGQQRIVTLLLVMLALHIDIANDLLKNHPFKDEETYKIYKNYEYIKDRLSNYNKEMQEDYKKLLQNNDRSNGLRLTFVVMEVDDIAQAFQLFDSQNTRGKELYPHDLLKAYHLREMHDCFGFEKIAAVRKWENLDPQSIGSLFSKYLFPILCWSKKEKTTAFSANDIDKYKGVSDNCKYSYAQRAKKAMPYYQINEPFCAGKDFFDMIEYYMNLRDYLKDVINNDIAFEKIKNILFQNTSNDSNSKQELRYGTTGFDYAAELFYCVVLFYYDRFHSLNPIAIKKLFIWAMMIRVDMERLGYDTINNYAIGIERYTNNIPMFYEIANARKEKEITDIFVESSKSKMLVNLMEANK